MDATPQYHLAEAMVDFRDHCADDYVLSICLQCKDSKHHIIAESELGRAPKLEQQRPVLDEQLTLLPDGKGYKYAYWSSRSPGIRRNFALASTIFVSIGLLFVYDQGVAANMLVRKDFRIAGKNCCPLNVYVMLL